MYRLIIKRLLDIVFSIILILAFSPLMLIIALIIRRDGGKAIFIQKRSGKDNIPFNIYKFRTMHIDNDVHDFKCEDRMTKYGKFLKNTSLDELPQLFNILKGDMSFIGPRPWITDYSRYFTPSQMKRLSVKPGLTGLAQACGRNSISINEKIEYDIYYVNNITFLFDIEIIYLTIKSMLKREGAHAGKFIIKNELEELKNQSRYKRFTVVNNRFSSINPMLERYYRWKKTW